MVVKSSLLFFPLEIGTLSVILYKGFRSNFIGFGAGTAFGDVSVSVHRAEVPIKKYKNISNCPDQGSLSVAFTNASVFGSQSAASVAVCACAWEKKKKKKKTETTNPPSLLWTEMPRRPRLLEKGFGQLCKGLCCSMEAPKPGVTLQHQALQPRAPRGSWAGEAQPGMHRAPVSLVCGKLSTNLPAVLHYLNVSKSSTFNVHKYILLQKKINK